MPDPFSTPQAMEYLTLAEERLPAKTYRHVQSVARLMVSFASQAKITEEQAVTAGLLHDICKALKKDELTQRAQEFGITEHLDNPNLLHGPVGAAECRRLLNIHDEEVLDAIRFHTTGRKDWGRVGRALYFADFAEPRRTMPEATIARDILERDGFEPALKFVAVKKYEYVRKKFEPDQNSINFFEWIAKS